MRQLETNWLTDGLIDFEYKKYTLLAYLKTVKSSFKKVKLYPCLSDLIFHYQKLLDYKNNKQLLQKNFPEHLKEIDLEKIKLIYTSLISDDKLMNELNDIVNYSLPLLQSNIEDGKEIYDFVEGHCELSPIGLLPLYTNEGYFIIEQAKKSKVEIYRYRISVIENTNEDLRAINTTFVQTLSRGLGVTYENLKLSLIKKQSELPNPAVFLINSSYTFPKKSTLLPVVKRLLVRFVASTQ